MEMKADVGRIGNYQKSSMQLLAWVKVYVVEAAKSTSTT